MSGATQNDVAVAALSLIETYLRNPAHVVPPNEVAGLITNVRDAALSLGTGFVPGALDRPFAPPALPAPVPAPVQALPAPAAPQVPVQAEPDASAPVPARGSNRNRAGEWDPAKVWPGVPRELRQKFTRLIEEHNIPRDPKTGVPTTRRQKHLLISADRMTVADPISGEYLAMLKRRLSLQYGLTYSNMLDMFHLTDEELPKAGPAFSEEKRRSALQNRLGHYRADRKNDEGHEDEAAAA